MSPKKKNNNNFLSLTRTKRLANALAVKKTDAALSQSKISLVHNYSVFCQIPFSCAYKIYTFNSQMERVESTSLAQEVGVDE